MIPQSVRTAAAVALAAAALLAGDAARAADAPHDAGHLTQGCQDCHVLHSAAGPTLTKQAANSSLCFSCHQGQTGATVLNWTTGDQAIPGTSGSSHRWDAPAVNPAMGARIPMAEWAAHLANGTTLQCSTCHDEHSQGAAAFDPTAPASGEGRHFLRAANDTNQLCNDCHAAWNQTSAASGSYVTAGAATFTAGGVTVTGAGTTWLATVLPGWRVKPLAAGAAAWSYVKTVDSDTRLTLAAPYGGTTATGVAYVAAKTLSHPLVSLGASGTTNAAPLEASGVAQGAVHGTATGGSATSLVQTGRNFSAVVGWKVRFTSGANRGLTRTITSVTGTAQINWGAELPALSAPIGSGVTYEIDPDGNLSNDLWLVDAGGTSATIGKVVCLTCHGVHFADSDPVTYDDRPLTPNGKGDGYLLRRAKVETCRGCHPDVIIHSSANTSTKHGTWGTTFDCFTCHQPHQTGNVHLVRPSIATPNGGTRDVDLRAATGGVEPWGLVNASALGSGACEVCHTDTRNGAEVTGATSTFTAGATAVTVSSTTGLAVGWELKRTGDARSAWTRIQTIGSATSVTLAAGGYKGTSGGGTWQAANPRFRSTGSGAGVGASAHYTGNCLGCHPHSSAFGASGGACTTCHGAESRASVANADPLQSAAPPVDHLLGSATTARGVGAHLAHVNQALFRDAPLACTECHDGLLPPVTTHQDGKADVAGGALALTATQGTAGAAQALTWNGSTCANTYCHGNFKNGRAAAPAWTGTFTPGSSTLACNSCHGTGTAAAATPPTGTHPQGVTACAMCHAGYTQTSVDKARHLDGVIDYDAKTCTSCHGTAGRPGIAGADANQPAAPPKDVADNVVTTAKGVGAHLAHVNQGTFRTSPLACTECHGATIPTGQYHADGAVQMGGGTLALNAALGTAAGTAQALGWSGVTCANTYCHGNFRGGATNTPPWTGTFTAGTSSLGCASCHPAVPSASSPVFHPSNTTCASCHGAGFTTTAVDKATHLDGLLTLPGRTGTCNRCHGWSDAGTTGGFVAAAGGSATNAIAAPGTPATTSALAVGTHTAHVNQANSPMALPFACSECHYNTANAVNGGVFTAGSDGHVTASGAPVWTGAVIAKAGSMSPGYAAGSCSNTYCHTKYATGNAPSWNTTGKLGCNACHPVSFGNPAAATNYHPTSTACTGCHGAGNNATQVVASSHVNGSVTLAGRTGTCNRCHGLVDGTAVVDAANADPNVLAVPGTPALATSGTDAGQGLAGTHVAHVNQSAVNPFARPIHCTECHGADKLAASDHANGSAVPDWTAAVVSKAGGITPGYTPATGSCATYCHGKYAVTPYVSSNLTAPTWTGAGRLACGTSCHADPPLVQTDGVTVHPQNTACSQCHPGYADVGAATRTVNLTYHLNGAVDGLTAQSCTSCHGGTLAGGTGATGANPVQSAPPKGTRGETTTSTTAVGLHANHLTSATLAANGAGTAPRVACVDCHTVPSANYHANGTAAVTFVNASSIFAAQSGAASFTGVAAGWTRATNTCANTYCHGNFKGGVGAGAVTWNPAAVPALACTACHGSPPPLASPTFHPSNTTCTACHGAGYTSAAVDATAARTHVDGAVTLPNRTGACNKCHGAPDGYTPYVALGATDPNVIASPGLTGAVAASNRASAAGTHLAHVDHGAGALHAPFHCTECHGADKTSAADHANGSGVPAPADFGTLAKTGAMSPAYNATAFTCASTYCHSKYNAAAAPTWTTTGQLGCTACHSTSFATPSATNNYHPANTTCSACHGTGFTTTTISAAVAPSHVDGAVTFSPARGGACNRCHGWSDAGTTGGFVAAASPATNAIAAPGTAATTSALAAGAHTAHVNQANAPMSTAFACSECHYNTGAAGGVFTAGTDGHANGSGVPVWTGAVISKAGGMAPAYAAGSCSSTYCHNKYTTGATPTWGTAGKLGCAACHAVAFAASVAANNYHPTNTSCATCHGAGNTAAAVVVSTHVNGTVNFSPARTGTCNRCHGFADGAATVFDATNADPNALAAPGTPARATNVADLGQGVAGAHVAHVNQATNPYTRPIHCTECHGPDKTGAADHANGSATPDMASASAVADAGGMTPAFAAATGSCASTYCHGKYSQTPYAAANAPAPAWATAGKLTCTSCHDDPPVRTTNGTSLHSTNTACSGCHSGYGDKGAANRAVNLATHLNGAVEASGESSGGTACQSCHDAIVAGMNTGAAHRHQMLAAQPATYPTTATAQLCLQCHADHNIFRADTNATAGVTRAKNLRTDIAAAPTATANYTDTDFDATLTNGGVCTSCHSATRTKAAGLPDAGTTTPIVDKARFAPSAHNYVAAPGTAKFKDPSTFKANCSKCHNDTNTKAYQTTQTNAFSLHNSTTASISAAMGMTAPTSPMEEDFCYRCHSQTGDALAGTKKTGAGKDWYGGQTMSTPSERIFATFQQAFKHPVNGTRNAHSVVGDTLTTRHVECGDCHDSHQTKARTAPYVGTVTAFAAGTAPAADTLTDSTKAWTANQFVGWTVRITSGTQAGKTSAVYGNTATTLQVKFATAVPAASAYVLVDNGIRLPNGTQQQLSPTLNGSVMGVVPAFAAAPGPVNWNDSGGCGAYGAANVCESPTATFTLPTYTATTAPANEAQICLRCHSSYAFGSNPPNTPSGAGTTGTGGAAWSNTPGAAMRQSDLGGELNPFNLGHHAVFTKGANQPMVSSATATRSVLNAAWPKFTTGTVSVTSGQTTVTLSTGSWPTGILPGWMIFIGSTAPAASTAGWYEVAAVNSATTLTLDRPCAASVVAGNVATATTCGTGQAFTLTPGLGATFVPPWGPWSRLNCSDCHQSGGATDPLGPHGSANKWMLRSAQAVSFIGYTTGANSATPNTLGVVTQTPADANLFCLNCHRGDVYGDFNFGPTPRTQVAGAVYKFSRQSHPADSNNGSSVGYRTRWGIMCMNCHGGARQGGIHGENLGIGNGGTTALSYSGKRLLGGASWYAVTRGSPATAGQCWTKGNTDAVDGCGHAHPGVAFESGVANYDYESTQTAGIK
jgi:predicted CxxxxCH...CXXCH cytochrome family protein